MRSIWHLNKKAFLKSLSTEEGMEDMLLTTRAYVQCNGDFKKKSFKKGDEEKTERFSKEKRPFNKSRYDNKNKTRVESKFKAHDEHVEFVRRKGFSAFQLRLVNSILEDVLVMHNSLDRAYAYWFNKVKIDPVEQGFLIKQINFMFSRLSLFLSFPFWLFFLIVSE